MRRRFLALSFLALTPFLAGCGIVAGTVNGAVGVASTAVSLTASAVETTADIVTAPLP